MTVARLIFEDGKMFEGRVFAKAEDRSGEVVFNTAMSGYQEILTDPSYAGQMVIMTYPLIGSYGVNAEDVESGGLFLSAFLVKEYIDFPSNFRSTQSLKAYLEANNILGVEGLDTRAITRHIREAGAMRAVLTTSQADTSEIMKQFASVPSMAGLNLAKTVSCSEAYEWEAPETQKYKVAVIDCGVKYNILRCLARLGCACTVFPYDVDAKTILEGEFDGVFLSNGPGDPEVVTETIACIKEILGKRPIFGICLGHQLLSLALGASTYKLAFGHHGANHPVKQLKTAEVEITSQNHGFCVDMETFSDDVEVTHINLNDQTVEGIRHEKLGAFSVQYHPEASPGPHDSHYLFNEFTDLMDAWANKGGDDAR